MSYINATNNKSVEVDLIRTGIAWESDKKYKFKNPNLKNQTKEALQQGKTDTLGSGYWYKVASFSVHTGPLYQYSVLITRYVRINFVPIEMEGLYR